MKNEKIVDTLLAKYSYLRVKNDKMWAENKEMAQQIQELLFTIEEKEIVIRTMSECCIEDTSLIENEFPEHFKIGRVANSRAHLLQVLYWVINHKSFDANKINGNVAEMVEKIIRSI
jgi:hypothetical protein